MRKRSLRIVSALLAVCLFATAAPCAAAVRQKVTVELDGEKITFSGAQPYYDGEVGRVYVPVRGLCEAMDAEVGYDDATKTVTVTRGGTTIKLRIGVKTATVNGTAVALDAPPLIGDGSTYVPLRFVSENFQLGVSWDAQKSKVTLTTGAALALGMESERAKEVFGEPARTAVSEKGYTWWVYDDLDNYRMIGVADGQVAALYLHSASWQVEEGVRCGMTPEECDALFAGTEPEKMGTYTVYTTENRIITVFFDENAAAYAVLEEIPEYAEKIRVSVAVLDGYARQFLDLVNVERHRLGLSAIIWDETICDVARNHSGDMAKNNGYSHTGSDGTSPESRLRAAGYENFYQIEIIARAFPNALTAFSAHLGNAQYRAVLRAGYTTMGAGAAYNPQSDGILYYTQVFYAAK